MTARVELHLIGGPLDGVVLSFTSAAEVVVGPDQYLCFACRGVEVPGHRVLRKLGEGGMGLVYLARQTGGREVAVKVMQEVFAVHPGAIALFRREMDAVARLSQPPHPHLVSLYETGTIGSRFYYTMEHCNAGTVRERGRLDPVQATEFAIQALLGIEHAHANGIIHRDLSPDNLFLADVNGSLVCKVGDFGLAKVFDSTGWSQLTRTGTKAGKPEFICRRQVIAYKEAHVVMDVWGLAACLYAMLTGSPPRDFPAGCEKWDIVRATDPVPIRQRANVPESLAAVIDTALIDSGPAVFPTAAALRAALAIL